jgi:hypothetical protein
MPNSTPSAVATPLPPSKLEEHRPQVAQEGRQAHQSHRAVAQAQALPNQRTSTTGSQPLAASSSSVITAAALLPERSTLVAPGFLLP